MWYYNGQPFTDDMIQSAVGFVYEITDLTTNRKYIGKKLFTKSKTYQKNKKKKRKRVGSDWMSYYGSNKELQEQVSKLGAESFSRNILRICYSKSELSYYETKEIFMRDALLKSEYYNSWVSVRINANTLINNREKHLDK
jgi:hypothetical protein